MRILHIACISNDPFSGVAVVVPQHVRAHRDLGNEVAFFNVNGVRIDGIDCQIDDMDSFKDPDIVIFQECYRKEYLKIYKKLLKDNIPYVIVPHSELRKEAQQKKRLKKTVANILLFNRFINGAAAVQVLSQNEYDSTSFGRRKIIGTNGIPMPEEIKTGFRQSGTKFLYIGRLDAYAKGLDIMVDAVKICSEELKKDNATIDIYGPDWEGRFAHLEQLVADAGVGDLISLHHEVTGEEKKALLLDCDIFIQTSRFEGMPMGILESLSYGIPTLVTRGTTLGEQIREADAGWSAETDADSVSEAILKALSEKDRYEEIGSNGRKLASSRYSWPVIAADTISKYKEITGK